MMAKQMSSGSFDIFLGREDVGGRLNICLSFGSGLFRKLGWTSGDWLEFDLSREGFIALKKIPDPEPEATPFYARKIKLSSGFYKLCFYSRDYRFPRSVELSKEKASFNLNTRALTLEIPEEYWQITEPEPFIERAALTVDDIAAAFRKL